MTEQTAEHTATIAGLHTTGAHATVAKPDAPLLWILMPKWLTARARAMAGERGRGARFSILAVVGLLFWGFIFGLLYRLLNYFKGVPEIGELLAGKLLGLMLVSFFSLLLLSNVITALSSFFLAKDLDLLVSAPVDWLRVYAAKLMETTIFSSWMVVLMGIPMFAAYGMAYDGGWGFGPFVAFVLVPFLVIPSVLGSATTLLLVNIFPARRTRDILSVIAVMTAGGIVLLFRLVRPEKLARPEGFRSLVDFIAVLRGPTSPLLPSEWLQNSVMGFLAGRPDWLSIYMLWSTAAALVVLGALLHRALYAAGFSKAQESAERWAHAGALQRLAMRLLAPVGTLKRELVMKEVRLFFRDSTQWSQLILLAVLVVVYVFNIKYLPLRGEGITFFLINVVPFLNLVLAGFVLASIAARFIFPGVSLEGRTLWLLRSSPLAMRDLLWAKFWVGTLPLLILALGIVGVTDYLLQVSTFMFLVSVFTITFMTFAIAGLAIGFGTMYPQYETENAAQIPTSFGGLLFMMASIGMIGGTIILEARPVYGYLAARAFNTSASPVEMVLGFGAAMLLCVACTVFPIRLALRRLEETERG
ncbi:MAG: putative ABC transporter permease subunit [Gemmatimonadaceae bacterium]